MKDLSARVEKLEKDVDYLEKYMAILTRIMPIRKPEPPKADRECRECEHEWFEYDGSFKCFKCNLIIHHKPGEKCTVSKDIGCDCDKLKPSPTKETCEHEWVKIYSDTGLTGKFFGSKCRHCSVSISIDLTKESKTLAEKLMMGGQGQIAWETLSQIATDHFKARFEEAAKKWSPHKNNPMVINHMRRELFDEDK